jgi:hypothetical protein
LAALHDLSSVDRVLTAMGLPTVAPEVAAPRGPPPTPADLPW